ncbi:MAG TPA: aminotransferase class I/II-fold pyridoxal phosphate-dependent enzyme, partial [Thermoanaerobaculia bacterium]|nr:aminotransferase class I/II-fold pyridoxal phosphate-dependent enzyme [Thermoanaerobaculia bacterium]
MKAPADPAALVRPELRRLDAYRLDRSPCRHKLDQNESPYEPPRRLKRQVAERLLAADWSLYPDFHADELRRDLGAFHDWPADGILVGNGSNELLDLCLSALVQPGGEVLGSEPSFALYRMMVLKAGGVPRFLPAAADPASGADSASGAEPASAGLRLPLAALLAEVARQPRRPLVLCSPNNPTGEALAPAAVAALLERLEGPLLLDNAYGEFCRHDYRPLLDRHPQLILLRTFSKAWALAGLRLGYLLADPRLVAELLKVKLPYNLGHAGVLAGRAALAAAPAARRRIAAIRARREQWRQMLAATGAGLEVMPSEANFLLVRCPGPAAARSLRDGLAARGIRVRDVGAYPGLAGCLRVSVGSGAALRATRRALAEMGGAAGVSGAAGVPGEPAEPGALGVPGGGVVGVVRDGMGGGATPAEAARAAAAPPGAARVVVSAARAPVGASAAAAATADVTAMPAAMPDAPAMPAAMSEAMAAAGTREVLAAAGTREVQVAATTSDAMAAAAATRDVLAVAGTREVPAAAAATSDAMAAAAGTREVPAAEAMCEVPAVAAMRDATAAPAGDRIGELGGAVHANGTGGGAAGEADGVTPGGAAGLRPAGSVA